MSNTAAEETVLYVRKINTLVADGREDLIAGIIADFERGSSEPIGSAGGLEPVDGHGSKR
jgi:hypothetical protein